MQGEELTGQLLGHYRIKRSIGYGGMAMVYLAEDVNLRREVAVKVFHPRTGESSEFFRRFAREAQVLAQLDHANILPVYDYGEQNGLAYLIMPYMAGGSLQGLLQAQGIPPIGVTLRLISQVLNALQYAHDRGLIHRDIKPGNILLKSDGTLVLSDFGLVKVLSTANGSSFDNTASLSTGQTIAGTPDYMAPEQATGHALPASDIYALGIVLYEMLTGAKLFTADSTMGVLMKHLYEAPRSLREINPRISPELEAAVLRALEKNPAQRYQRPADFLQALVQAAPPGPAGMLNPAGWSALAGQGSVSSPLVQQTYGKNSADPESNLKTVMKPSQGGPATPVSLGHSKLGAHESLTEPDKQHVSTGGGSGSGSLYFTQPEGQQALWGSGNVGHSVPQAPSSATERKKRRPLVLVGIAIAIVALLAGIALPLLVSRLFGIGTGQNHDGGGTPQVQTPLTRVTAGVTTAVGGNQISPTATHNSQQPLISCPQSGTARAAMMPVLRLGTHANVIYIVNEGPSNAPTFGTVKRYDVVTGSKVEIVKIPGTVISEAQVSADGQWTLFAAQVFGKAELRMVRMDGAYLQTLLCAPAGESISGTQWSSNQKAVIFDMGGQTGAPSVYLLDTTSGAVQAELLPQSNLGFVARTWLDSTRIYMLGFVPNSGAPPQGLYMLDTRNGGNQTSSHLHKVADTQSCWDFDSSFDGTRLFTSQCNGGGPGQQQGPSSINVQPAIGGSQSTVYSDATLAITTVRAISGTNLLVLVENTNANSQNGLWEIHTDGTGFTRLTTDADGSETLCQFSQYPWSNVSRDGSMYALEGYNPNKNEYTVLFGSFGGGNPTIFADIFDGTQLRLVGWTTI